MLRKKNITLKGNLSVLPKEKSKHGIPITRFKKLLKPLTLRYIFIMASVIGLGVYFLFFAHAATDPYSPDYIPPVPKQQLIDDITQYHDGGHFPFTPDTWCGFKSQTYTELPSGNKPGCYETPGQLSLTGSIAGIYEWIELSTRENSPTNVNAVVEFREVGLLAYRQSQGKWETINYSNHQGLNGPLKAIVNDYNGGYNIPGYAIGLNWSPNNNRMVGFGLGSGQFGTTYKSSIPNWPDERLKAHASIAGNSYGAGVDYCTQVGCQGSSDIKAIQGWVTARVVTREGKTYQDLINSGDTAGAQQLRDAYYVFMPGWDRFNYGNTGYAGTMGRARKVLPEWQTFTNTSMSQAQINGGLPAPPIPGYTTSGTTNQAPNVTMSSSPTSATTGQSYTLTANASDSDGSVAKIEIFQSGVSKKVCTATTTCAFATSNTTAATYSYTAVATDNSGATTTAAVSVTVASAGTTTGKLYLIGDSWMERERDNGNLMGAITAKGWLSANVTINAYGGRSPADGLQTAANNATAPKQSNSSYSVVNPSALSQSDVIVINLGQNVCEWHGTDAELASPDTYGVNALVTGIDPNCNNPGIHFTQAQYDATVTKMASVLNQINPSAKKIWIEPADPSNSLLQSALATKAGPTMSVNTSLFRNDIWNSVPTTYLDNSWHPTPYYAGILSGQIADAIGAPGTVTPPTTGLSNGTYNDTDTAIGYTGSWTPDASSTSSYSGDEHYTNTPGDSATFQFNGEQLQLISHKNTDMGQATIKIDGVAQSTVGEWYANPAQTGAINWTSNKLSKTNHTVVITVNSTKNAASAGNYVSIDKIIVSDAPANTVVAGDVDGDGHVNLSDLSILGQNYGKSAQQKNQGNLDGDVNGVVNIYDLSILGQNWGK